jgi:hypothetical protein
MTAPNGGNGGRIHRPDGSLQGWGRRSKLLPDFIQEWRRGVQSQSQAANEFAAEISAWGNQAGTELPADKALAAEAEAIGQEARAVAEAQAQLDQRLRALEARAASVHGNYQRSHATDEARLGGERAPVHQEKRADVGHALQDT